MIRLSKRSFRQDFDACSSLALFIFKALDFSSLVLCEIERFGSGMKSVWIGNRLMLKAQSF